MANNYERKIAELLEKPTKINEKKFCFAYLDLSENFWRLADQDSLLAIESALELVIRDINIGIEKPMFKGKTVDEVIKIFEDRRIQLFSQIPSEIANIAKTKLDFLLKNNSLYAKRNSMIVPGKEHLTIREYYYNYQIVQQLIAILNLTTTNFRTKG